MELSSHQKRLVTAAVGLPVVLAAIFAGGWFLFLLMLIACVLGMAEYLRMAAPNAGPGLRVAGGALAALTLLGFFRGGPAYGFGALLLAYWLENMGFLVRFATAGQRGGERDGNSGDGGAGEGPRPGPIAAGLLYLPCSLGFFLTFSPTETLFALTAVIVADTGAYYSGSILGGPKIWPAVSPKKTWSGSLGGLFLTMAWCLCYGLILGQASAWAWLGAGAAINVAAQFGDFYESALKRAAGVKDSGSLLPGHGGILDRIDGLVLAAPAYAALRSAHAFFG